MASVQLFAFVSSSDSSKFYYGEFVDNHIMIGAHRALYTSNIKVVPASAEWRAFLHEKVLEFEYKKPGDSTSSWSRRRIRGDKLQYMLQHDSGYVMPLFRSIPEEIYKCYPCMSAYAPTAMPKQAVKPPSIVASTATPSSSSGLSSGLSSTTKGVVAAKKKLVRSSDDNNDKSSEAEAIIDSDDDDDPCTEKEWKRERDALSSAVNAMLKSRKVGFKT